MKRSAYNPAGLVTAKPISLRLMPTELREAEQIAAVAGLSKAKLARAAYLKGLPLLCKELALASPPTTGESDANSSRPIPGREKDSIDAFISGYATIADYDTLATMRDIATLASRHKETGTEPTWCAEVTTALNNIRDRFAQTKRMEAGPEDLNRIREFAKAYWNYWAQQPAASYIAIRNETQSAKDARTAIVTLA